MTDKKELMLSSLSTIGRCDGNDEKETDVLSNDKPSTSTVLSKEEDSELATELVTNKSKAPAKKKNKNIKGETAAAPTASLYQKFVSSFDAVIQNIVSEEENIRQVLSRLDIDGIGAYIKEEQPKNIIFMVGAGISTSAGIPDFRTPGTGLYSNLKRFNLPDPQAVFDISFFKGNPEPFYILARDLFHENIKNIDALEYSAGVSEDRVVTAHGSHQTSTCQKSSCRKKYNKEWLLEHLKDKEKVVAKCDVCGSIVKPDIVFFGEKLSNRFFSSALGDFPKCDLLIIMGTSLVVQPFASLVQQVSKECPRLLVNLVPVGTETSGSFFSDGDSGPLKYNQDDNKKDVFWQGTCDDGALKLARILGWEDELKALAKANNSC